MINARARIAALLTVAVLCLGVSVGFFPALESVERWAVQWREEAARKEYAPYERYYDLTDAVRQALRSPDPEVVRRANGAAEEILNTAETRSLPWEFWNEGNAIHYGHLALGRIALVNGDIDEASRQLLCAGMTPGSPQLGDYGPDMTLAEDLLRLGHVEAVLRFLEQCQCFWRNKKRNRLEAWRDDILSGKIPHFGSRSGLSPQPDGSCEPGAV